MISADNPIPVEICCSLPSTIKDFVTGVMNTSYGVYVIALDDALYVKRLQILPGKKLKVKSDNLNYDPFEVSLETDNFHIVGKVIWAGGLLECIK